VSVAAHAEEQIIEAVGVHVDTGNARYKADPAIVQHIARMKGRMLFSMALRALDALCELYEIDPTEDMLSELKERIIVRSTMTPEQTREALEHLAKSAHVDEILAAPEESVESKTKRMREVIGSADNSE
jgi:H2-forming N5,N10-methylenetetrahydromethanopterin dehydrogenase-like enzyme